MQNELQFRLRWGGLRKGSGRKKKGEGTAHCARKKLSRHDPAQAGSYVWPPGWKLGVGWRKHYAAFALRYVPG